MTIDQAINGLPAQAFSDLQREAEARSMSLHDYCQQVLVAVSRELQAKQRPRLKRNVIARLFGNSTAH